VIDFTVRTRAIISALYVNLPANGSELVLFDLNKAANFSPLLRLRNDAILTRVLPQPPRRTNAASGSIKSFSGYARSRPRVAGRLGSRSEFSPDQKMIDGDHAAAVHQEIEGGHGPHQREFEAHLIPEKSAHSPAFVVRHDEKNDDRAGSEASD
jgi:hypothetical protein